MKKIIFIILLSISFEAFSASESRSMRTPSGEIVSVGDSYISMLDKLSSNSISTRSYEIREGYNKYTVNEYIYLVDNIYYTISIVNNSIRSISWDRKS